MMITTIKLYLPNYTKYGWGTQNFRKYLSLSNGNIDFVNSNSKYYSTFNDNSDNLYGSYKLEQNKLKKVGINKIVVDFMDQINETERNNIKLLDSRFNEIDNIPGYIFNGNINLNGIDENFVTEFYKVLELGEYHSIDELDKYFNYGEIIKVINLLKGVPYGQKI